jgi:hypothetical protein
MIIKGERAETGMHSAHAKTRGHGWLMAHGLWLMAHGSWLMAQASWQAGLAGHVTPQLSSGSSTRYTAKALCVMHDRDCVSANMFCACPGVRERSKV